MKPGRLLFSLAVVCLACAHSSAADFFWDGNNTTADADGGTGDWDGGASTNWNDAASGGSSVPWPSTSSGTDTAVFGGTAGTVTINAGGVTANALTFDTAGYSLGGGSITLDGTSPTVTNNGSVSISSNLSGTAGLTKIGNGTLSLSGNNSALSGALVISGATSGNNGGVLVNGTSSIGGITSVDIQNNSFLRLEGATLGSGVAITIAGGGGTAAPEGALRGNSGSSIINGAVTIANGSVRVGNLGTSTTFNGAVTAAPGSGFGLLIRKANNDGVIFTNTGNSWEGTTQIHDGSVYFAAGALPSTSNLQVAASTSTWFESNGSFTRAVGTGANQIQFNSTTGRVNGFSARGGDLTVNLGGSSSTLTWGTGGFTPAILGLTGPNSTGKLTWENPINLNGANRTIDVRNGSAAVDAEMSGAISGGTGSVLTKQGTGVLLLSNANTHAGGTVIAQSQSALNPLRISHGSALGTGSLTIGGGGNQDQARLELTGGITVTNSVAALTSRNNFLPTILNISGNNTMSANLSSGGGGARITMQSDGGKLTLGGNFSSGRSLLLTGAGDGEIQGTTTVATGYGLEKSGAGTWILGSGNLNNTTATVSDGTLLVNGTLANSSAIVNGGTLGGAGSISGAVSINTTGALSPGASIGAFGTGALTLNTGSTFLYELNTTAATGDLLNVNGDLDFNGTVNLNLVDLGANVALAAGTKFTLLSYAGAWTSGDVFSGYADDSSFTAFNNEWLINYNDTSAGAVNGGLYSSAVTLTVIPEPASALLGGIGTLLLLRRRRR